MCYNISLTKSYLRAVVRRQIKILKKLKSNNFKSLYFNGMFLTLLLCSPNILNNKKGK